MAHVEISGDTLTVHIDGWDKVLALKGRVDVPLAHVLSVTADPEQTRRWPQGLRLPGTFIPRVVIAGSYWKPGRAESEDVGWSFWDVHDPARAVVIRLDHEHYKQLVVGVDDPQATVAAIEAALAGRGRATE